MYTYCCCRVDRYAVIGVWKDMGQGAPVRWLQKPTMVSVALELHTKQTLEVMT